MHAPAPGQIRLSATDLSSFAGCRHRTGLDLAVALGLLEKPRWSNPVSQAFVDRGDAHERAHVARLQAEGLDVVDLREADDRVAATVQAMRDGIGVIVQGALEGDGWFGYPDILRRVGRPSALGDWSYEVHDTKLARETRGGTILQLAVYSELLGQVQGLRPERFCVVTPDPIAPVTAYRLDDYAAYYRLLKSLLKSLVGTAVHSVGPALRAGRRARGDALAPQSIVDATYPEPVEHCGFCRWGERCEQRRRADDHLSFIAGAGRLHRAELEAQGVRTLAAAAAMPLPVPFKPARGSRETYARIREQARVQWEQRESRRLVWELLEEPTRSPIPASRSPLPAADPAAPRTGLRRMPEPSPGDIFLDLESARFAREGGREYLFGVWSDGRYRAWWATTDAEERAVFETVVDLLMGAWARDPGMHVYHFGHYEVSAFKRLAGRYATRTDALDRLLRAGRFIDLHAVTRQAIRAGVESYSIKQLEQYTGYTRQAPLAEVGAWLHAVEIALEADTPDDITADVRALVEAYNADDCRSTQALRDWLEGPVREAALARGDDLSRPELSDGAPTEDTSARDAEVEALRQRLLQGIEGDPSRPDHPQHARWLLAYLIDWHRREERVAWWEYLHVLEEDDEEELRESPSAIVGVQYAAQVEVVTNKRSGKPTGSVVNRYRYPVQEVDLGRRGELTRRDGTAFGARFGDVVAHDKDARTIDVRVRADADHPDILFVKSVVLTKDLQASVMRLAEDPDARTCGLELLNRRSPRSVGPARRAGRHAHDAPHVLVGPDESPADAAVRLVLGLDRSYLAIQGPPGAGKTYTGAHMIRALVRAGRKVGVTAVSHKVICNLLEEVRDQASAAGERITLARKGDEDDEALPGIEVLANNGDALAALRDGRVQVLGGTAWLWAKEAAAGAVDVLFVDEAGQMSLANVLAVSQAADSLVLLGDPQQLEQPQKGSHPDGVDVSALQHVIGDAQTMPPELGLFLPETWRLAPAVCAFTSEVFYEGKLHPRPTLARQVLRGAPSFEGAGLWYVPVEHTGNQNASPEEVDAVAAIVSHLLSPGSQWIDAKGTAHTLTPGDLRVVSPYNAQVGRLLARLGGLGVPVGTVDRFQGQEAPVVIYSMATSRPEDAPRGMEFLYSLNRLNVATSRARCAAIVVASPALFEPECRTPRQMKLANALCRFRELATRVRVMTPDTAVSR